MDRENVRLTDRNIQIIEQDIKEMLEKLSIRVDVNVTRTKMNSVYMVETTEFQTMPALFRKLYIGGCIWIVDDEEYDFGLSVHLDYKWHTFCGGSYGTTLGQCDLKLIQQDEEEQKIVYVGMCI